MENSEGRHFGEASCREFRESLIHELPHLWDRVGDTKIAAAHFAHHKKSKKSSSRSSVTKKSDSRSFGDQKRFQKNGNAAARLAKSVFTAATSTGFVSVPAAKNPTTGSKQERRDQKKNALVVFQEEGIEVLHIFSGRPLCKMLLPPHVLHCDIDGDGVVDHAGVSGEMGGDEHGDGAPRDEFGSAHRRSCWYGTFPRGRRDCLPIRVLRREHYLCPFPRLFTHTRYDRLTLSGYTIRARVTSGTPAREVLWEGEHFPFTTFH